jgi:hypothetical protein
MACPEKAIADKVYFTSGLNSVEDIEDYLFTDLRIEREDFTRMEGSFFAELAGLAGGRSLSLLAELVGKGKWKTRFSK